MARSLQTLLEVNTERLRLRLLGLDDASAFRAVTDEPAITEVISFLPTPFELADARQLIIGDGEEWIASGEFGCGRPNSLIGAVGAHLRRGADEIEIGYWLARSARGRGFAAEAASAIVRVLQFEYPARPIIAKCRP